MTNNHKIKHEKVNNRGKFRYPNISPVCQNHEYHTSNSKQVPIKPLYHTSMYSVHATYGTETILGTFGDF